MVNRPEIIGVRPVDDEHEVVSVASDGSRYRREPCRECPWRVDRTGRFPAEAFRQSARVAEDLANSTFGCHMTGIVRTATCAGFLLAGADHNLAVRRRVAAGQIDPEALSSSGHELHAGYRTMAEASGVPADDPALARCRASHREAGLA